MRASNAFIEGIVAISQLCPLGIFECILRTIALCNATFVWNGIVML